MANHFVSTKTTHAKPIIGAILCMGLDSFR